MTDSELRYPRVIRLVAETPWAILPERLALILDLVALRAAGERLADEEIAARIGAGPARRPPDHQGTVAVLPLYGTLAPRASLLARSSGGTSLTEFQAGLRAAAADRQVDAILVDIDSPGGSIELVPETAAAVRAARGSKPVVAIANTMAASAAYWIASQADELVASPSATVGSIGVYAAHQDLSRALANAGVKTTLIRQPAQKADLSPFEPLSEEARQAAQVRVDEFYGMFTRDVAAGRKTTVEVVRSGFGEGRVVTARGALAEGMIDRIDTLEGTVARLIRGPAPPPGLATAPTFEAAESGLCFADEAAALRDSADALVDRLASLAEVERGRMTQAKRELLAACLAQLREAAERIDSVLSATDPHREAGELALIRARLGL